MITYIYFVKCPDCEDEHFDFFDEAKEFALGCLTKKPIITQTEVTRNDFGECVDHCDLGTVWSWEDIMQDTEPDDETVFSKNETFGISEGLDDFDDFDIGPQMDEFDNSLDFDITDVETAIDFLVTDEEEAIAGYEEVEDAIEDLNVENKKEILDTLDHIKEEEEEHIEELEALLGIDKAERKPIIEAEQKPVYYAIIEADGEEHKFPFRTEVEANEYLQYVKDGKDFVFNKKKISSMYVESFKKPIPEGMTLEQLVEELEENEDMVECKWCEELFPKEEGRFETGFGGLICRDCQNAAYARGEKMIYKDSDYLDFLDEDVELTEGRYDFPHLTISDDKLTPEELVAAKEEILTKLHERGFGSDGRLMINLVNNSNIKMWITDFVFTDGKLEVVVKKSFHSYGADTPTETYINWELKRAIAEVKGLKFTYGEYNVTRPLEFLNALTEIAGEVNTAHNLGVAVRNDRRVASSVAAMTPEVATELKSYIKDIEYRIPPKGPTGEYDVADIKNIDPQAEPQVAEKAADKLNRIYNNFYSLPFADDAVNAGMVEERIPNENAKWILDWWGGTGKISFKGPISNLSDEAQALIVSSRMTSDPLNTATSKVDCYRLANALITYFNNDVRFFEHGDLEEVYDLGNEYDGAYPDYEPELSEVDETPEVSDSHLKLCPECGKASFDLETGICIECGFN